jgi:hypothetical protein
MPNFTNVTVTDTASVETYAQFGHTTNVAAADISSGSVVSPPAPLAQGGQEFPTGDG